LILSQTPRSKLLVFHSGPKKEKVIEEMAFLIGDPEEVDKSSLAGKGPVRVKVQYKDPKEILVPLVSI